MKPLRSNDHSSENRPDLLHIYYVKYSALHLIGSRIKESATYCNQILLIPITFHSDMKPVGYLNDPKQQRRRLPVPNLLEHSRKSEMFSG